MKEEFMKAKYRELMMSQIKNRIEQIRPLANLSDMKEGWIRTMRNSLGMTGKQLGNKIGVTQERITRMESDEIRGGLTLKNLRRVAEKLNCTFVYGMVPNRDFEKMIEEQSEKLARKQTDDAFHTMSLEKQALTDSQMKAEIERLKREISRKRPKEMWDV
jgi:predicted DNA-binding mobile mystery protein A